MGNGVWSHTEISKALSQHNTALELSKHGCTLARLDDLAGYDVDHQTMARVSDFSTSTITIGESSHVPGRPSKNGDQLSALDNKHSCGLSFHDANNLCCDSDRGNNRLQDQAHAGSEFLDRPSSDEEIEGTFTMSATVAKVQTG